MDIYTVPIFNSNQSVNENLDAKLLFLSEKAMDANKYATRNKANEQ